MISSACAWQVPPQGSPRGSLGGRTHPTCSKRRNGIKKGHATIGTLLRLYPNRLENTVDNPRLDILRQLLAQDPANTFVRYGLAMEHVKSGDLAGAVQEFEALLTADPNYSAAYYHGGQALEKMGELDQARKMYRRGIAVTRDPHALSEIQAALDILGE